MSNVKCLPGWEEGSTGNPERLSKTVRVHPHGSCRETYLQNNF